MLIKNVTCWTYHRFLAVIHYWERNQMENGDGVPDGDGVEGKAEKPTRWLHYILRRSPLIYPIGAHLFRRRFKVLMVTASSASHLPPDNDNTPYMMLISTKLYLTLLESPWPTTISKSCFKHRFIIIISDCLWLHNLIGILVPNYSSSLLLYD